MNVASLKLSRELYDLSAWGGTDFNWHVSYDDPETTWASFIDGANGVEVCPAYDLDYLVRKFTGKGGVELRYGDTSCYAISHVWSVNATIPENAVAFLAIRLFKEGILKKEQS